MKLYVIDTNFIFSAIIKPKSAFGQFFELQLLDSVRLYSPSKILEELSDKETRMVEIGQVTVEVVRLRQSKCLEKITIIPDHEIPFKYYAEVLRLVRDVDYDDISFVALTENLDGLLVTGDKELRRGLIQMGYAKSLTFPEMLKQLSNG